MKNCKKLSDKNFDFLGWFFYLFLAFRNKANIFFFNYILQLFFRIKGIKVGQNIKFNGYPIITRVPNSCIAIGNNCMFNSSKKSVPVHLHRRCTFVTLRKKAEIVIGNNSGATGVTIAAYNSIRIGDNVLIGAYCTIIDNDFHNTNPYKRNFHSINSKPVVIEDNVFLGINCTVLKGVTIGKNSVIAANSVVISNIPPNSFAMGNPCKLIVRRDWQND